MSFPSHNTQTSQLPSLLHALFPKHPTRSHKPTRELANSSLNNDSQKKKKKTHRPPCQLPNPFIASACTLVILNKFSVSDKFLDN